MDDLSFSRNIAKKCNALGSLVGAVCCGRFNFGYVSLWRLVLAQQSRILACAPRELLEYTTRDDGIVDPNLSGL